MQSSPAVRSRQTVQTVRGLHRDAQLVTRVAGVIWGRTRRPATRGHDFDVVRAFSHELADRGANLRFAIGFAVAPPEVPEAVRQRPSGKEQTRSAEIAAA